MNDKAPSAVEHDESVLNSIAEDYWETMQFSSKYTPVSNMKFVAKQYAEHLTAKLQAENDALREALQESHELAHQYNCDYLSAMGSCGAVLEPHPLLEQSS